MCSQEPPVNPLLSYEPSPSSCYGMVSAKWGPRDEQENVALGAAAATACEDNHQILEEELLPLGGADDDGDDDDDKSKWRGASPTCVRQLIAPRRRARRRVAFSTVQIREYAVTLGDHPHVTYPLSLDWKYSTTTKEYSIIETGIDDAIKLPSLLSRDTTRKRGGGVVGLDLSQRQRRLLDMGLPKKEILRLERARRIQSFQQWAYGNRDSNTPRPTHNFFIINYALN